ncbi:hypothetical protein JL720_13428 [Aureococcus anophagefferens]|nr:hypothetical protein JL720_13428 [Aureococcus anophagefferens]
MKNGKNGHHRCAPARNGRAKAAADLDADARPSPLTHAAARAPRAAPSVGAVFAALFPAAVAAPDVGFLALGADSLDLQSLADALGASPTLLLERCTYAALRDGDGAAAAEEPSPEPEACAAAAGVVEVFAALFPAAVAEPDVGFLALGADSLDLQALADALGSPAARYGAFLAAVAFDARAFRVAGAEAAGLDAHAVLVLAAAAETAPRDADAGVFVGAMGRVSGGAAAGGGGVNAATAAALSVLSGRVSYALGLAGPCASLDTACSSARADGYARGQGAGAFALARRRAGSAVATAVRQDGRSASLTAPNGAAQRDLVARGGAAAVEAHGTGTALGDPVEVGAVAAASRSDASRFSALKASLGHLEAAAAPRASSRCSRAPPAAATPRGARRRRAAASPGASAIDYYAPSLCVAASALEAFHGCAGRYTVGRGQDRATACGDDEDAVSLGATALASLLARCRLGTGEIGRLEVGTESAVDRGKSIKSFLMALFGDHRDVEGADPRRKRTVERRSSETSLSRSNRRADTTNACYGGTNAFLSSARWIGDRRTYAVVVCADPAVHPDPARLSEVGAAGCAVLASARAALPLEAPRATFVKHAWDFYRPVGWRTNDAIFHVAAATAQYDEALLWCARSLRLGDAPERFAFHNNAPYHAKRNLRVLRDDVAGWTLPRADHDAAFLERAAAGLGVAAENGTTYTCPLYASLLSFALSGETGGRLRCMAYGGLRRDALLPRDARRPSSTAPRSRRSDDAREARPRRASARRRRAPPLARGADPDAVAAALAFDVVGTAFGADEPMMAAGFDSLGASELAAALGKALSSAVSSTLVFDHPTLRGLAAFLGEPRADEEEEVGEEVEEEVEEEDAPSSPPEEDAPPSPPEDDAPPSPTDEDAPPSTHSPATMKVVAVDAEGGDIAWRSAPRPTLACRPGRRGVVVAPTCVGLSFADNLFLHGRYQVKRPLPIVPGIECAGVATAALAYAALGVNYTTAYFALAVRNATPPGGYLLVLGAAGGLGAAAVELGALLGYEVIACASTPEKRAFCAARGATRTVDYSRRRWHRDVVAATGGVDLVVDPVGGDALVACLRCVAVGGAVLSLGYASGATGAVPVEQLLQRNVALVGVWASRGQDAAGVAKASKAVVDLWRAGKLRPPVDVAWPLSDLRRGLARVAGRKALGKVVLVVPSADWAAASPPKTEPPVPLVAAAPAAPGAAGASAGARAPPSRDGGAGLRRVLDGDAWPVASPLGLPPAELAAADAAQVALLEAAVLLPAGAATAVFAALSGTVAGDIGAAAATAAHGATGKLAAVASGSVSYALGYAGPCATVDTACSSSSSPSSSPRARSAGAARTTRSPRTSSRRRCALFAAAGMLSPRGRCHTFDARADGYARGEGVFGWASAPRRARRSRRAPRRPVRGAHCAERVVPARAPRGGLRENFSSRRPGRARPVAAAATRPGRRRPERAPPGPAGAAPALSGAAAPPLVAAGFWRGSSWARGARAASPGPAALAAAARRAWDPPPRRRRRRRPGPPPPASPLVAASPRGSPRSPRRRRRRGVAPADAVAAAAAAFLGTAVDGEAPLMAVGLDSVSAAEFSRVLGGDLGSALPATLLFDHPNINALVKYATRDAAPTAAVLVVASDDSSLDGSSESSEPEPEPRVDARGGALLPCGAGPGALALPAFVAPAPVARWDPRPAGAAAYGAALAEGAFLAGRVSYALGLTGPCASLATACSSSLVALNLAAAAVAARDAAAAVAAGAGLLGRGRSRDFAAAGMLSPRGRCHAFDGRADGYCRGEGAAAFAVAADDGESDLATAVRQDGKSASLTAPNGSSQKRLLGAVAPGRAGAPLEAHGTGTALGDPIEVAAAAAALAGDVACASSKGGVGHLEAAAAAAGLLGLRAAALRGGRVAGNGALRRLNAHLGSLRRRAAPRPRAPRPRAPPAPRAAAAAAAAAALLDALGTRATALAPLSTLASTRRRRALAGALAAALSRDVPATLVFDGGSLDGVAAALGAPRTSTRRGARRRRRGARARLAGVGGVGAAARLEAHGTGTALGDPVEVAAAALPAGLFAASLKATLGHLEAAAAAAGSSPPRPSRAATASSAGSTPTSPRSARRRGPRAAAARAAAVAAARQRLRLRGTIAHGAFVLPAHRGGATAPSPGRSTAAAGSARGPLARRAPPPRASRRRRGALRGRLGSPGAPSTAGDAWDYGADTVLIIGGGLDGVLSGGALTRRRVDFELFELEGSLGGVWVTTANLTSKVQTGKLTYTLDLEDRSPRVADESNFQPADEVAASIAGFALRMGIDKKTSIFREVTSVAYEPWPSKDCGVDWTDRSPAALEAAPGRGLRKSSVFQGVIFACGSLRSPTLAPMAPAHYGGYDSYGVCGDARPCEMAGRDLVVAGHGAYGVENVRTGLEHGAKAITLVCRHRHAVMPRCAVWLLDAGRAFDAWDEISKMLAVAKLAPAYTTDRRKRPAVSDQYYAATRFGRACVVHGEIRGYDASAPPRVLVETSRASGLAKVRADVALLCYGFSKETSIVNRTMGVFEEGDLTGIWVKGQRRARASCAPIWTKLPKAGNAQDTTSFDFFASTFLALVGDKAVQPQLAKIIRRVQHVSVNDVCAWTDFVEDCAGDWRKYVGAVGVPGREEPYGDWLGRSPSPHPDGLGQREEASRALAADGPLASPAAHRASVLVFDDAAAEVGAGARTAAPTPGRTPGVLVLAFPRDVLDLAVGTLYAAEAKVPHTVVLLKDRSLNAFHAQLRVARVEQPRLKLSSAALRCGGGAAQLEELCEAPVAKDCVLTSNSGVLVPSLVEAASSTADARRELRAPGPSRAARAASAWDALATRVGRLRKRAHLVAGVDTSGSLAGLGEAASAVFSSSAPTFGGVVHAAGVLRDALLRKVERWMVDAVTGPKASNLGVLRGLADDVVHFTSATVVLGGPGQTAYAHGSGALDDDALGGRAGGRRSSALQWLAIEGVGMHQEAVGAAPQWTPLATMERILASAVGGDVRPSLSVLPEAFLSFVPAQLRRGDGPSKAPEPEKEEETTTTKVAKEMVEEERAPRADVGPLVEAALRRTIEAILETYDPANDDVPFMELGVDSMGLTDFAHRLNGALGVELPDVALFEYPTVSDLRGALIPMVLELRGDASGYGRDGDAGAVAAPAPERPPLQRQLLEVGYEALEAAGVTKQAVRDGARTVGTFVALQTDDFARAIVRSPRLARSTSPPPARTRPSPPGACRTRSASAARP